MPPLWSVSRHQVNSLCASVAGKAWQHILRRIVWLRLWSGVQNGTFRVRLENNPADPMAGSVISQAAGAYTARQSAGTRHGRGKRWNQVTCISQRYPGDPRECTRATGKHDGGRGGGGGGRHKADKLRVRAWI